MGTVVRFPARRHARASSVASQFAALKKSSAVKLPPDTPTIRSTNPRDGVCNLASIRDRDAFDVPASAASSSRLSPLRSRYDLSGWLLMAACYMDRNSEVKGLVTSSVTTDLLNHASIAIMAKSKQGQHFIRAWRQKRNISLRKLAGLLPTGSDGEPLVGYASLSRIESGEQPFSEPILNAISDALDVPRAMLLELDPNKEGHVVDLLNQMDRKTRDQAIRMLEAFAKSTAA
jgi:transcriptional regulator with XRE-family HTH domain